MKSEGLESWAREGKMERDGRVETASEETWRAEAPPRSIFDASGQSERPLSKVWLIFPGTKRPLWASFIK